MTEESDESKHARANPASELTTDKRPHRAKPGGRGFRPFKKGEGGRPKGSKNKATRILKELIIIAADVTGRDGKGKEGAIGYLSWLARKEPAVFGMLLGKVLPLQVQMSQPDEATQGRYSSQELRAALISRGLRVPTLIDATPVETTITKEIVLDEEQEADYAEEAGESAEG